MLKQGGAVGTVVSQELTCHLCVLYLIFKFLLRYISPLLESACLALKRLQVPPLARAESQCLILTAQARTKPLCVCVHVPAGDL